ncbi:MAG: CAP domain-containing protein [Blastocatellales bacterium]
MNRIVRLILILLTIAALLLGVSAQSLDAEEQAMLRLINQYRAQYGLAQLGASIAITRAAEWHGGDMAAKGYLSHVDSQGRNPVTRLAAFGYGYQAAIGENVAAGYSEAAQTFSQWRNSAGHNAVMLYADFRATGIARAFGSGNWFWTADFGGHADAMISGGSAQSCIPPLFQGYPSSCTTINLRWLNQQPISLIDHYEIYRGGALIGTAPGSAISFSETAGCDFAAVYTIKQVMKSGASCQVVTTNNPPHTKPCGMCSGSGGGGGSGGASPVSLANAASFRTNAAPGSISVMFGSALSTETAGGFADTLGGLRVTVGGRQAKLFYVSPIQANILIPDSLPLGLHKVIATNVAAKEFQGDIFLARHAPGVFTKSLNGQGFAAADYQYFPKSDPAHVYVILFVTGIGFPPNPTPETIEAYRAMTLVDYGGLLIQPSFVGPAPGFYGLQQINLRVPKANCEQKRAATVTIQGFNSQSVDIQCPRALNVRE